MNIDFNVTDFFKLPTKIMVALALGTGIILFLPDSIIKKIYLDSFRINYEFSIGIIFIISFTIFIVTISIDIFKYFKAKKTNKWFLDTAGERLSVLNNYQKAATQYMVNDLNNAYFPYFLQPWVIDELKM